MSVALLQKLFFHFLREAVTGPLWWYTEGVLFILHWWRRKSRTIWHRLDITRWMRNVLVPVFGQYDWQGRLVSVIIRVAQIIGRTIAYCFAMIFVTIVVIAWMLVPIGVLWLLFAPMFN